MSLVDYASSDEEEDREEADPKVQELQPRQQNAEAVEGRRNHLEAATMVQLPGPKLDQPRSQISTGNPRSRLTVNRQGEDSSQQAESPAFKLPDASLLLSSPTMPSHLAHATDHSSRVAAAMAESESRKRDLTETSSSSYPRSKVPRGNLPHSKNIPDTVGGHLLPPQLTGRKNIVTEDLSKLFVKKHAASSDQ